MFTTVIDTTNKEIGLNIDRIVYIERGSGVSCVYMANAPSVFLNDREIELLHLAIERCGLVGSIAEGDCAQP